MANNHSQDLFAKAQRTIPGGVNSPVRAFQSVDSTPIFFKQGQGAYLTDEDSNHYIDYVGAWGPLILGHAHPAVIHAVQTRAKNGLGFGAAHKLEVEMAEKVCSLMPNINMLRLVSSGTEACMTAIRLARAYTQRDKIIKFTGCYHGHADSLLIEAGSGVLTLGIPGSPGIPAGVVQDTLVADYNNLQSVEQIFLKQGKNIAAIIVEPVAANMGCVLPTEGFLAGLRALCDQYNSLLIFDEVITGFRVALGGAQDYFKITPDLTILGKIIGGGLPVAGFGGKRAIMELLAPSGPVYQAGTLSGNPVALSAGLATLNIISNQINFYPELTHASHTLTQGIQDIAKQKNIPICINQIGSLFGLFFTEKKYITNFQDVMQCNKERFKKFFHQMLSLGIYLAPSPFESGFVSAAHGPQEIQKTLEAIEQVFSTGLI